MPENTAYDLRSDFSRANYGDLSDDYQAAYDWFEAFGFSVAVSRLRRYKACIDELADNYRQGSLNSVAFKRDFDHQVNALSEATEIMRIHRGLANLYSSGLKEELKKVLSGKDGRPSPSDFDPSRDTAFGLLLASRCQRVGLQVEIGGEVDLIVLFNGTKIFVECKRLKSPGTVRKRIKDALKQLHRRYKSASDPAGARGILALSITDLANPEHGLMVGYSPDDVAEKLQRHLDAFILRQRGFWHDTQDKRTIGTVVELSAPSVIEREKLFTTCHLVTMNNSCSEGTRDLSLLLGFAKKLAEQGA